MWLYNGRNFFEPMFEVEGGNTGAGGAGGDNPAPETTPNDPTPGTNAGDKPEPKKLEITQDELDRIISERLARVKKKYEGYDEYKKKAQEYEKLLEEKRLAELSEKERLEEIAKKHEAEKQELAQKLAQLEEARRNDLISAEIRLKAQQAGAIDVEAALLLVDKSKIEVEDGKVIGVDEAIKALKESKAYLFQKAEPKPVGGATNNPTPDQKAEIEEQLRQAAERARRTGRIEDRMAYAELKRKLLGGLA